MANEFTANWKGKVKYLYELLTAVVRLPAGLAFPATKVASSDANTLDDYEEGTWTPVMGDGTNNYTLSVAKGYYTIIGNMCFASWSCTWTSIGSAGAGQLRVTLPFTVLNEDTARYSAALGAIDGVDTTATLNQIVAQALANTAYVQFSRANDNASSTALAANAQSAAGGINGSIAFRV